MEQYTVTGMSCAACSSRVEKAVSKLPGVASCSVSLLTNSMGVEGTASQSEIIAAVEAAGYGASVKGADAGAKKGAAMDEDALKDRETPIMKRRLIASLSFLIPLMYISMGHMMWNWPLPGFLAGNHVAMGLIQLLFTGIIMVNQSEVSSSWNLRDSFMVRRTWIPWLQHGQGILCIQHLCIVCNDRCTGEDGYGRRHVLYA